MTAQRWDGTEWSLVPIESSLLSAYPNFQGLACASASSCFAVGGYGYPPRGVLMARWNGTSWSLVSAPKPAGATVATLSDVSCPSVSFCIATGNYENGGTDLPYSARWNGTSWSVVAMATPSGALDADINGVSCVGVSNCVAVGEYTPTSADDQTLIERWNGTVWTIVSSPTPVSVDNARLAGVSCPSSSFCFAVGSYQTKNPYPDTKNLPFGLRWNGSSWSIVTTGVPSGHPRNVLTNVSCVSSTFCFTSGSTSTSVGVAKPWLKGYNGTSWTTVASPAFGGNGYLSSVACASTTACFAVGSDEAVGNELSIAALGLVDRWDGSSWKISTPPAGGSQSGLRAVSCVSASFCMAVGSSANGASRALVERWNGTRWLVSTTPIPAGTTGNSLRGISCTSSSNCFAVGRSTTDDQGYRSKPLIERWNGTDWRVIPSPPTGTNEAGLISVSCAVASRCVAVGSTSQSYTLTEHWDGSSWTINAAGTNYLGYLESVSCATETRCMAVGKSSDWSSTFARRWNGTTWSTIATPDNPGGSTNDYFTGVSCTAPGACTAVGTYFPNGDHLPLIERWNGSTWTVSPSPDPGGFFQDLLGVSCATATSCVAVGTKDFQPLIEEWHGSGWTVATSRIPAGSSYEYLFGVDAMNSTRYVTVGRAHTTLYAYPLVEQNF
jgi:hypothetical protein